MPAAARVGDTTAHGGTVVGPGVATVLIAVTAALLVALVTAARRAGTTSRILVAHAHHGLRPEADDDLRFVENLAAELGVGFATDRLAVRSAAGNGGEGLEARARRLCAACPVTEACRSFARANHEYGFWGGESEDERHAAGFRLIAPIGVRARNIS